jgi:hypothetical protein
MLPSLKNSGNITKNVLQNLMRVTKNAVFCASFNLVEKCGKKSSYKAQAKKSSINVLFKF